MVVEVPQRVRYLEALDILKSSHGLLLLGSDEPHYTASKVYVSLLSGRPSLGIFHEQSSACRIMEECGGSLLVRFREGMSPAALERPVAESITKLVEAPYTVPPFCREKLEPYTAAGVARGFSRIFNSLADQNSGDRTR